MQLPAFDHPIAEILELGVKDVVKHLLDIEEAARAWIVTDSGTVHFDVFSLHESEGRIEVVLDHAVDELSHVLVIWEMSGKAV